MIGPGRAQGSVLLMVVALVLILSVGAAVLATLTTTGTRVGADQGDSVQALYHAESGLEWAAWDMRRQVHDEGEGYASACGNLDGHEDAERRYRIRVAENQGTTCRIELVGAMPGIDSPRVQRRLRVTINRRAVVVGGGQIIVQDPDNWAGACAGANRICDGDSATFRSPSGSDQLNRSGAADDLVDSDAFSASDEVFLFLRFRDGEGNVTNFGLNRVPGNGNRDLNNHSATRLPDGFSAGVSLGDGFTPEQLNGSNNLQFVIAWSGDRVTIEASCIGTLSACRGGGNNPADQWAEE